MKPIKRTIDSISDKTIQRFAKYVDDSGGPWACWEWQGTIQNSGYGFINFVDQTTGKNTTMTAHRMAALLAGIKLDDLILHTCDNPRCCNPSHLMPGTQKDNIQQSINRGRFHRPELRGQKGSKNKNSKLTEAKVKAIRELKKQGKRVEDIAQQYNVHPVTVWSALSGKTWRHVE